MLLENGIIGFVLVFLTLWLMLRLRLAFWVAVGIPISFLGTMFVIQYVDLSLNMITMFSLIMALGIIVDDAIIIGENIFAHYARGKSPQTAAVEGTREVTLSVAASMLTTSRGLGRGSVRCALSARRSAVPQPSAGDRDSPQAATASTGGRGWILVIPAVR